MSAISSYVAYFAGFNTATQLRHKALIDLALAAAWGGIAYWQCGKSWLLYSEALLGCWARIGKALKERDGVGHA
jgi:hypothetical protein